MVALGLVLLAWRYPALRPEGPRTALVAVGAAAYAALIWLVTWQAERGEPLAHPSEATLFAAGSLLSAAIIVSLAVVVRAQRTTLASVRFRG